MSIVVIPSAQATDTLDAPFIVETIEQKAPEISERDIVCLAKNIYFEARGESPLGQKAVAFVTMNRVKSGRFADDVCGVVHQRTNGFCQFSWVCMKGLRVTDFLAFEQARTIAIRVLSMYNELKDPSKGALYFSARSVRSGVGRTTTVIGDHAFYR